MRLADALLAAVGGLDDHAQFGAIASLAAAVAEAQHFELADEVAEACREIARSKPSSLLSALPMVRAPYAKTWFEWCDRADPNHPPASGKPVPKRLGCLVEAHTETLDRGTYTWTWMSDDGGIAVLPFSIWFDYRLDADIPAQLHQLAGRTGTLSAAELGPIESVIRRMNVDATLINEKARLLEESINAIGSADMAAPASRWRRLAGDPEELVAARALARHTTQLLSLHCLPLWNALEHHLLDPALTKQAIAAWQEDLLGEEPFAHAFLTLLNARQALDNEREDLARLNKQRLRKRQTPLCEFIVTRLRLSERAAARAAAQGLSRAAARRHLVRGHFKTRRSGIYWWTPFYRGRGEPLARRHYAVSGSEPR
jgi:hypothetical protein